MDKEKIMLIIEEEFDKAFEYDDNTGELNRLYDYELDELRSEIRRRIIMGWK